MVDFDLRVLAWDLDLEGVLDVAGREERSGIFISGPKVVRCQPPEDVQG